VWNAIRNMMADHRIAMPRKTIRRHPGRSPGNC
jgi:hypothetical protein